MLARAAYTNGGIKSGSYACSYRDAIARVGARRQHAWQRQRLAQRGAGAGSGSCCGGGGSGAGRLFTPRRRLSAAAPPPAAVPAAAAAESQQQQQQQQAYSQAFEALAGLVTVPGGVAVTAGPTPRGRGLSAARPVPAGAPLLEVELWNALTVADAGAEAPGSYGRAALGEWEAVHGPLPPALRAYVLSADAGWFNRLVAWLLHVRARGGGVWPLYVATLPASHESLMHFDAAEARELQDEGLAALAARERAAIASLHDNVFSSSTGSLAALRLADTEDDTRWAASMVNSRCFAESVNGEALSVVVPCADLANHDGAPNAMYMLSPDEGVFRLVATREIAPGDEICISYLGSTPTKSNADLLKDHGFVVPGNPNDRIPFASGDDVQSRLKGLAPVPNALNGATLAAAAKALAQTFVGNDDVAADNGRLTAAMRSLMPFCRPAGSGQNSAAPSSGADPDAGRQAVLALLQQCESMSAGWPTTLEYDEGLLAGGADELSPRVRAAVTSRLERKRVLRIATSLLCKYRDM